MEKDLQRVGVRSKPTDFLYKISTLNMFSTECADADDLYLKHLELFKSIQFYFSETFSHKFKKFLGIVEGACLKHNYGSFASLSFQ